ncbi:putative C4-dicarboxylate transport system permease small protein [uncultured delta proteobacterium]|uniref:Putative C4-dicarboxylate transport system permease small protein n=1 Tax=uncultured delta proteobacterium TaxID=34034 RepID=A0A212IW44_9DELT|nr:putative C4-dicarboxylate transport system permease small protein [uncultured delta proteobacterium]
MQKTLKLFDYLEEGLIFICLAFMTVMNFINVISRYCFTNSFSFTEEITVITFVWLSMLGIAAGFRRVAHLGMSYFVELAPKKTQAYMALFSMVCSLTMIVFMVIEGVTMVDNQIMLGAKTAALEIPLAFQGLAMPVGGVFIGLRALQAGFSEYKRISAEARSGVNGAAACR